MNYDSTKPVKGGNSPWGKIDDCLEINEDFYWVSTPSHGGVWVDPDVAKRLFSIKEKRYAEKWSGFANWFEEDCAIAIPLAAWPDGFNLSEVQKMNAKKARERINA